MASTVAVLVVFFILACEYVAEGTKGISISDAMELHKHLSFHGGTLHYGHAPHHNLPHDSKPLMRWVLFNEPTNPSMNYLFDQMNGTITEIANSDNLQRVMYCAIHPAVLPRGASTPQMIQELLLSGTAVIFQGEIVVGTPNSLSIDPISAITTSRVKSRHVIYLYPTVGQQFFVLGTHVAQHRRNQTIYPVFRDNDLLDHEALLDDFSFTMGFFNLSLGSFSSFTSTVDTALHATGMNVVVGLTHADLVPLAHFLDEHPLATVMINFDELTLLYDDIFSIFQNAKASTTDRILYATNLPRWTSPPTNPRAVVLSLFFRTFDKNLWTPAALRTFLATFFVDYLVGSQTPTESLMRRVYSNEVVALDDSIKFGPYLDYCLAPLVDPSWCLVNFGARDAHLWSLTSQYNQSAGYLSTVNVHIPTEFPEHPLWKWLKEEEANNQFLCVVVSVICLSMLVLALSLWRCIRLERQPLDDIGVSVVHVLIGHEHAPSCAAAWEALGAYSEIVGNLVGTHEGVELESNSKSFTVLTRRATQALELARDLHVSLLRISAERGMHRVVSVRVGVHSGTCRADPSVNGALSPEYRAAVSPICVMAQCVARVACKPSVLLTAWTRDAAEREGMTSCTSDLRLAGHYTLDNESTIITVFRMKDHILSGSAKNCSHKADESREPRRCSCLKNHKAIPDRHVCFHHMAKLCEHDSCSDFSCDTASQCTHLSWM